MSAVRTENPFLHRFKYALGEQIYIPGCLCPGQVISRANMAGEDQYEVTYYSANARNQAWFHEWELEKQENKDVKNTQH